MKSLTNSEMVVSGLFVGALGFYVYSIWTYPQGLTRGEIVFFIFLFFVLAAISLGIVLSMVNHRRKGGK